MSVALAYDTILNPEDELRELIEGCIANSRSAQASLYKRFYPKMMAMVRRYFPEKDKADEILNNGFLRAFQKMDTFAFRGSFEGWLRRVIFTCIANYAEQNVSYSKHIQLVEKDEVITKDLASGLFYDDLLKMVYDLPEKERIVFNMYVFEEMSHKEIAKSIGLTEGTSKWYLSEARKHLKEKIVRHQLHFKK